MSDATTHHPESDAKAGLGAFSFARLVSPMGLVGFIGLLVSVGLMLNPGTATGMSGAWMFGWFFWVSITLGMFALTALHHAVRGQWTLGVLRMLEAGAGWINFVVLAVLFSPILLNFPKVYEWADPSHVIGDRILEWKAPYLNLPFFGVRFIAYFAIWALIAYIFRRSTMEQERTKEFKLETKRMTTGAVAIVIFMLTSFLALTDFVMSMEPHWSSTMYGPWQIVAGVGGAFALCLGLVCINAKRAPFKDIVHPGLTRDMGNMLFAFTMLWGYTSISQFLIIWNGNIPEMTSYFVKRSSSMHPAGMEANSWGALGLLLIVGRFFVPFFLLLAPRTRRYTDNLQKVCGWVFVMHIFDMYMLVIPAVPGRAALGPISVNLGYDILAWVSVGALWLATFAHQTKQTPLLVSYDNRIQEAKAHAH